jgi:hypothetical protein
MEKMKEGKEMKKKRSERNKLVRAVAMVLMAVLLAVSLMSFASAETRIVVGKPVKWVEKIDVENNIVKLGYSPVNLSLIADDEEVGIEDLKIIENGKIRSFSEYEDYKELELLKRKIEKSKKYGAEGDEVKEFEKERGHLRLKVTSLFVFRFFGNLFNRGITGNVISGVGEDETAVVIDKNVKNVEVTYYTESPEKYEKKINNKKKEIVVSANDELGYENVLAFTELPGEVSYETSIKLYRLLDGERVKTEFKSYDKNENGLIDYIEWIVPHLSDETYELEVNITDAEHLNETRDFVMNIYEYVNYTDNITYEIPENEFVRAYFEINLTNKNIIDIFVNNSEPAVIEVYEKDSDVVVGMIENVVYGVYFIRLNHSGSQSVFDMNMMLLQNLLMIVLIVLLIVFLKEEILIVQDSMIILVQTFYLFVMCFY